MASESDPINMVLAQLQAIRANQEAFQEALALQESRHVASLEALRKDFEEQLRVVKQSVSASTPVIVVGTENSPASKPTQKSGDGLTPSRLTPPTTRNPSDPVAKSDRLPDPPLFNGKRKDLPSFLRKLRYKLEGNADRFPSERSQLLYAHSRLDRDVTALIDSLMDKDIVNLDQFVAFLQATYGDPNKELTALSRLNTLRQGRRSFTSHFAEFRRIASDTGLNEIGLIAALRNSLSTELQRAMVGESLPNDLNAYANLIATYDNNMRFLPVQTPIRPRTSAVAIKDPDAMEIDSNYAPIGSKEREDRRKKGQCFKCGKHGHISRNCSVPLPQVRASSAASTRQRSSPSQSRFRKDSDSYSSPNPPRHSRRSRSHSRGSSRKGSSRG